MKKEETTNAIKKGSIKLIPKTSEAETNNISEVKYTAEGFNKFLDWRKSKPNPQENSISKVFSKENDGIIKVDFAVPKKPKKAFEGWTSSIRNMKRELHDVISSCIKSAKKKPKL